MHLAFRYRKHHGSLLEQRPHSLPEMTGVVLPNAFTICRVSNVVNGSIVIRSVTNVLLQKVTVGPFT
jgi:hypothetical protein